MKNSFVLYTDYMEHLELLSMEQRGILFTALMCYQQEKEVPEMDLATNMAFSFIKQDMDANNEKYMKVVERNRENGKKGGRPKTQNIPKNPSGFSENPNIPKKADNDNDNNNIREKERLQCNVTVTESNATDKKINYQQIVDMYNDTCVSFPKLRSLSDARKKAIKARLNTYTIDDFKTLFEKAEQSSFLKGSNDRNWSANFDWLIKDSNMAKVLDGNYDNKEKVMPKRNAGLATASRTRVEMNSLEARLLKA